MSTFVRTTWCVLFLAIWLPLSGCGPAKPTDENEAKPRELRSVELLVVDDPELAAAIDKQWSSNAESELKVSQTTTAELLARKTPPREDAIIYPSGLIGELAKRDWLDPFPEAALESNLYESTDVLLLPQNYESKWANETLAVTFSSPLLCLAVRTDLLADQGIAPPKTWQEYQKAVQTFAKPPAEVTGNWAPAIEPVGNQWGGDLLLARTAAQVRDAGRTSTLFNLSDMNPQIDTEPFVESLSQMAEVAKLGDGSIPAATPLDAQRAILAGQCAMAITWPMNDGETSDTTDSLPISYFPLPGSDRVWRFNSERWDDRSETTIAPLLGAGGRLGSLVRDTNRSRSAGMALALLSGQEWSPIVCTKAKHAAVFRNSHLSNLSPWADDRIDAEGRSTFSKAVVEMQTSNLFLMSPRIPGQVRYMQALNDAVQRVLNGETEASASLTTAADQWRAITNEIGVEEQKAAYRHSLGIR